MARGLLFKKNMRAVS